MILKARSWSGMSCWNGSLSRSYCGTFNINRIIGKGAWVSWHYESVVPSSSSENMNDFKSYWVRDYKSRNWRWGI